MGNSAMNSLRRRKILRIMKRTYFTLRKQTASNTLTLVVTQSLIPHMLHDSNPPIPTIDLGGFLSSREMEERPASNDRSIRRGKIATDGCITSEGSCRCFIAVSQRPLLFFTINIGDLRSFIRLSLNELDNLEFASSTGDVLRWLLDKRYARFCPGLRFSLVFRPIYCEISLCLSVLAECDVTGWAQDLESAGGEYALKSKVLSSLWHHFFCCRVA